MKIKSFQKNLLFVVVALCGLFALTSCDTTALEQALADANQSSAYGRPTYSESPGYYPYRPAHDEEAKKKHPKHPYQTG